jgi:antitoxin (DNA-binding transcriptional repressor) of toxin-antitoxin stability system
MRTVDINEVGDFHGLLREALNGEPIILSQDGKPRLQVTVIEENAPKTVRRTGFMKGAS